MYNICNLIYETRMLSGDIVEFGCFRGVSALVMQKFLDENNIKKTIHVYDSFEGLPAWTKEDRGSAFKKGFFHSASEKKVLQLFKRHSLKPPIIHAGWFSDISPEEIPEQICFAHLDGDLYRSILDSLRLTYPKVVENGVVVIDDYLYKGFPGAKIATKRFLTDKPEILIVQAKMLHAWFVKGVTTEIRERSPGSYFRHKFNSPRSQIKL